MNNPLLEALAYYMRDAMPYGLTKYLDVKEYICKQCGKKFKSVSHNKTIFCSADCFKAYKEKKK